ncbi:MAG: twin-arginine translocation signal domain-containing protein, partial [Terriglobia bacterium]
MNRITRRGFLELTAIGLGGLAVGEGWTGVSLAAESSTSFETLSAQFRDPDRKYS